MVPAAEEDEHDEEVAGEDPADPVRLKRGAALHRGGGVVVCPPARVRVGRMSGGMGRGGRTDEESHPEVATGPGGAAGVGAEVIDELVHGGRGRAVVLGVVEQARDLRRRAR